MNNQNITAPPRRSRVELLTRGERYILDAKREIENMGDHPDLTEALKYLSFAFDYVADYVDAQPTIPAPRRIIIPAS